MSVFETVLDLRNFLKSNSCKTDSVIDIKSRILFEILESKFSPVPNFTLPYPPTGIGCFTVFEATILSLLIKLYSLEKITEIGTFIGYSSAVMSLNTSDTSTITTIDLPIDEANALDEELTREELFSDWKKNDQYLTSVQSNLGAYYITGLADKYQKKISMLKYNSMFLPPEVQTQISNSDLFFIDGGHSYEIIQSDTNLADSCLKSTGFKIWHDYRSKVHSEVTDFIDKEYSKNNLVFTVQGTMLVFSSDAFLNSIL